LHESDDEEDLMENTILIGGIGGQGVMVFGQLLCYTAVETTDKYVTYFPSYGMEKRGGTSNCYVTISDDPVGAPKAEKASYVVVLADPAMDKFQNTLLPGGTMFVDSSVCTKKTHRTDVDVVEVPAGEIARELGDARVANLCMIGAFIGYTQVLPPEKVLATAFKKVGSKRPELNALNEAAFYRGLEIGTAARGRKKDAN
jgi:2-oxoglutarate ferredoxin oxidoreductase subunit gamma